MLVFWSGVLGHMSPLAEALLDASLLTAVMFQVLHWVIFRPLMQQLVRVTQFVRIETGGRQRLEDILDQTMERILLTDANGVIEYVNGAFERTTGYSRQEAIGQTPRIVKSDRHDAAFYEQLWATLRSGESFSAEFINKRKNGELYRERQVITPLKDSRGCVSHFLSTAIGVTPETKLRQELTETRQEFESFQGLTWNREERMVKLKQEVNALLQELGRTQKYSV